MKNKEDTVFRVFSANGSASASKKGILNIVASSTQVPA